MTVFALASGSLPKAGLVAAAVLVATALVRRNPRQQAAAMLGALVLAPALLLGDIWNSPQLAVVHRHPLVAAAAAIVGLSGVAAVAVVLVRRTALLAPLAVAALPFRVPIATGASTANLLVPLYLVIAAGALAFIVPRLRPGAAFEARAPRPRADESPAAAGAQSTTRWGFAGSRWLEHVLALYVVLYALQSLYSVDFEKALQQMVFFYVPFAVMFVLLREMRWTHRLLRSCLIVLACLALLFALVGFVEYATKTIFLNPKLIAANDVHTYFTVNSVFFDPDIFGRFLALMMILVGTVLLYDRRPRDQLAATLALAVLWPGLLLTLSRSSLGALLVGLATVAGSRWKVSRTLLGAATVLAIGAVAVAVSPTTFGLNQGLQGASSGRAGLISGGIHLFTQRPLWGYGSGSFVSAYRSHDPRGPQTLAASHAIPITVAAEQGLIGELVYLALVLVAALTLVRGARVDAARTAIAAAFLALLFHTLLYADFLEDPATWTLAGIGLALATGSRPLEPHTAATSCAEMAPVPA